MEPSILFSEMRKATLGLGWESPLKGTAVLWSAINSQVELTLSPSFDAGRVALTFGVEAEARLPLTSAANGSQVMEDAVRAGWAGLLMFFMDGLALFALAVVLLPLLPLLFD